MSHIRITVDGNVLMDVDPGEWSTTPPDIARLKLSGEGQPWMLAIMASVAKAATLALAGKAGQDTAIGVTTRPAGWTMSVDTA